MAYVKLAPLAVFLLATLLLIFPMKKVDASCGGSCSTIYGGCGGSNCRCNLISQTSGFCSTVPVMKIVEEHPNLCQSHVDCMKKGSGNFCARYTNPDIQYGWCFVSNSEVEANFNIASNSEAKGLFKIPVT